MSKKIHWKKVPAAIWRPKRGKLKAVSTLDPITFSQLLGIERQKQQFSQNLHAFLAGHRANHTLLWGARGTGKSSLMKAALNAFAPAGLRVVELEKEDIADLPEISDLLRHEPWRFVIYCDDLAFAEGDQSYRYLKVIMEGSIEPPPENILIVATSNQRHLLQQSLTDNRDTLQMNGDVHLGDRLQEKLSLADRFGLSLSFYAPDQTHYLQMVEALLKQYAITLDTTERQALEIQAIRFATARGSRSGRIAKQFIQHYMAQCLAT
ncbi:MAG: ATP-binding protein [Thiotrichales bacterium]|nr:ATP-binding protein [Thiotrichales bacterium]